MAIVRIFSNGKTTIIEVEHAFDLKEKLEDINWCRSNLPSNMLFETYEYEILKD